MEIIREVIEEEMIGEDAPGTRRAALGWGAGSAGDQAKKMGLDYLGFGRYGKDGQTTHHSVDGKLQPVKGSTTTPSAKPKAQPAPAGGKPPRPPVDKTKTNKPAPPSGNDTSSKSTKDDPDMEIDGMYFNKEKLRASNPELLKRYDAAKKVAGGDVYMRNGKFYKQAPLDQRNDAEPIDTDGDYKPATSSEDRFGPDTTYLQVRKGATPAQRKLVGKVANMFDKVATRDWLDQHMGKSMPAAEFEKMTGISPKAAKAFSAIVDDYEMPFQYWDDDNIGTEGPTVYIADPMDV